VDNCRKCGKPVGRWAKPSIGYCKPCYEKQQAEHAAFVERREKAYWILRRFCEGPPTCLKLRKHYPQQPFAIFIYADDHACQGMACGLPLHLDYKLRMLWDDKTGKWNFGGCDKEPCTMKEKHMDD
jgi:hypothetical protein